MDDRHLVIVTPVYNDWESLATLVDELNRSLAGSTDVLTVIAIDDASHVLQWAPVNTIVRLTRNVGHQRAIAVGLDYALRTTNAGVFAVMDADGEDRPDDLPRLLAALAQQCCEIAVASRRRRREGTQFRIFYAAYKIAFRLLTGEQLDFGNFCVMRRSATKRLVNMHELWLNLPATIMRSKLGMVRVQTDRGCRFAGQSHMGLVSLVTHGLSAIGVFSERAFTRVLLAIGGAALFMLVSLAIGLALKTVGLATPGWVTTIAVAALIVLIQSAIVALCGLFIVFGQATNLAQAPSATAASLISHVDRQ